MEVPHPTVAGRYRLVEQIGAGGMGVVWRAEDERLRRPVAVKLLRPPLGLSEDEAELATQRAMREARITAQLHHPHAVAVFDVVEHEGRPGLVMQYVPSVPLSAVLREGGPLSLVETVRLGAEVASALAAAHQLDIVHRDVKPGNILVAEDGSAMLSDFGISRVLGDATLTVTGMVHGTPAYLAPEVARGASSDASTDVYSLGSTLYAALEGHPPFGSDPNPIVLLHLVARGEFPPPQRSGPLTSLLLRMLAVDPAQRPTMAAVAGELATLRVSLARGDEPTRPLVAPNPEATRLLAAPAASAETAATPVQPSSPVLPDAPVAAADQTAVRAATASATRRPPARTAPSAALPPAAPRPGAAPVQAPPPAGPSRRGRVLGWLAAVVAILLLAGLAFAYLGDGDGTPVGAGSASPSARSSSSARSSGSGDPSASDEPRSSGSASASVSASGSASASESESPSTTTSPSATPRSPSASASAGAAQLVQGVVDYYAVLPGDTDAGWARLTSRYRGSTGGRGAYDGFWNDFRQVSTSKVAAAGDNQVEATVTYTSTNGRRTSERRSFTLVEDDGVLKIDSSSVV